MEKLFKVGDVVVLKSGGPEMTIQKYIISPFNGKETGNVICLWFIDNKQEQGQFAQEALKHSE